ncbi:MAG: hypothetical protein ACR2M5_06880 [Nakamurella sp.]
MAMTLRFSPDLDEALRAAAAEDHRSVQQEVTHAVEAYLAPSETEEIKSDPETLRGLAEAREPSGPAVSSSVPKQLVPLFGTATLGEGTL